MALFEMRLPHEGIVSAQATFLTNLQNLDVVSQELALLKNIGGGVIPEKRIIAKVRVKKSWHNFWLGVPTDIRSA